MSPTGTGAAWRAAHGARPEGPHALGTAVCGISAFAPVILVDRDLEHVPGVDDRHIQRRGSPHRHASGTAAPASYAQRSARHPAVPRDDLAGTSRLSLKVSSARMWNGGRRGAASDHGTAPRRRTRRLAVRGCPSHAARNMAGGLNLLLPSRVVMMQVESEGAVKWSRALG